MLKRVLYATSLVCLVNCGADSTLETSVLGEPAASAIANRKDHDDALKVLRVVRFGPVEDTLVKIDVAKENFLPNKTSTISPLDSCWRRTRSKPGLNNFYEEIVRFFLVVEWCGDGNRITVHADSHNWGEVYTLFWRYTGSTDSQSGGVGYDFYNSFAQGKFELCLVGDIGCIQQFSAQIELEVFPNGTYRNLL